MKQLSFATLKEIGYQGYLLEKAPEKVLQFGEGNFLRAFVNYWFDVANEKAAWNGKCVLVQPIPSGLTQTINGQEGLYTLYLRGTESRKTVDKKRVISSISRCLNPYENYGFEEMIRIAKSDDLEYIVSNTTEAGIVYDPACQADDRPCTSFPGKLTQVLYARFLAGKGGLVILSCELIDNNGKELQKCVNKYIDQWKLSDEFRAYVNEKCVFCSTLVDRIVPGRIKDTAEAKRMSLENGYQDELMDVGEVFGVWNIEGPEWLEEKLPFKAAGVNCHVVADVTPYKKRKVRILNGAHTGTVLGAYLCGYDIVRDCMHDSVILGFMNKMLYEEIVPILPLEKSDLLNFAASVQDRFNNPFIDHELLSISLNSTAKWRARNLPSLLEYVHTYGKLPRCLAMGFAAYIAFFTNDIQELNEQGLVCRRSNGNNYTCMDDRWVLEFYYAHKDDSVKELVPAVMRNQQMWGQDLTLIPEFERATVDSLRLIREEGMAAAYESCLEGA